MGNDMSCDSSKPRLMTSQCFFNINNYLNNNKDNYKTPIKMEFTLENGEIKHIYQLAITMEENKSRFNTEVAFITQNSITFNSCYICDYFFEKQQYLNITLLKDGKVNTSRVITLGTIIGSPNSTYKMKFGSKNENLIISIESLKDIYTFIDFDFRIKNPGNYNFANIKNKISYKITNRGRLTYQSESISSIGQFKPIRIPLSILEPNFTISFLNSQQEVIIFKDETLTSFIEQKPADSFYVGLNVNNNQLSIYNNSKIFRELTFIDYIKTGVTIKLSIGIDFTASNKQVSDPTSLHYLGGGMNDYELAIQECGIIVAYYDYNQLFPAYGFGAVIKGKNQPNMCFNINFKENPEIYTIDNVLKEYHKCFDRIILAGPTQFCPLVRTVINNIKTENNPFRYHVLMILTDGIIVDQQETIDALVEGSFLPLSVIIIGIGDDTFEEMIQLDGDDVPLISSQGVKRMRDLVQFVPFNKYKHNPKELAAQVLEEIPTQIMEYYTMNNIYPENIANKQINVNQYNANNMNMYY